MTLDNTTKHALKARAHQLKSTIQIGREGMTEPVLTMIRGAFGRSDLIKIRIRTQSASEADGVARAIAAAVPCELVARTGFVAVLYRIASTTVAPVEGEDTPESNP